MASGFGKAILFQGAGTPLVLQQFPLPQRIETGAILVKTSLATVCGSDVHTWKGRRAFPVPAILGHEIVGRIVELGPGVSTDSLGSTVTDGDRITWALACSCGSCLFCSTKGLPQKCLQLFKYGHAVSSTPPHFTGGFAEYVYVRPGTCFYRIPEDMADEEAAPLMCAAATVTAGFERVGLKLGERVLIQGAGMLGLYATAIAKASGAGQVIVIDQSDERLHLAEQLGADQTLNLQKTGERHVIRHVHELSDGWGVDVALEVSGSPEAIPAGVEMLRTGGRYLLQGAIYEGDTFVLDGHDVITRCLTVYGYHNYEPRHLGMALQFAHGNRSRCLFRTLVGPLFPLTPEGLSAALEALHRREALRPAIVPAIQ